MSAWSMYPPGWPKCWFCNEPAMDGHLTCGEVHCNESAARDQRDARQRLESQLGRFGLDAWGFYRPPWEGCDGCGG